MNEIAINVNEEPKVPADIEKVLKLMPMQQAVDFHEWMSQGLLASKKIPQSLMNSYLAAKSKMKQAALTVH